MYSCCTTRALHLDIVEDLSGTTFIRSFRRFTARRGTPSVINTDNAKTFKYTAGFLKRLENDNLFTSFLQEKRISWKFNLERLAKLALDEIRTLLIEIEGTLNNRPITYVYDDVHIQPLTPSHLLHGRRLDHIEESLDFSDVDKDEGKYS